MGFRRTGFFDRSFDERVIAVWKFMAPLIAIKRWRESTDIYAFTDSPFVPVGFTRHYLEVFCAEIVLCISGVLHDGRFEHTRS